MEDFCEIFSTLFQVRWAWSHQQQLLANSFDIVFMAQNVAERSGAAVKFWLKLNKFYYGKKKRWRSLGKVSYFYCFTWETSTIFPSERSERWKYPQFETLPEKNLNFSTFQKLNFIRQTWFSDFPRAPSSPRRAAACHVEEIHVLRVKSWLIAVASGGAMPTLPPFILD